MSEVVLENRLKSKIDSVGMVRLAVRCWFAVAALGHWLFLIYILVLFFPLVAAHGLEGFKGLHLPTGFREGDTLGNLASVSHVLLAAIIIGGGPLQLIPAIRRRLPGFHRWLGRSYLLAAVLSSVGGLYMTWIRSTADMVSKIGISGDGILILVFASLALRNAMRRQFDQHRRWALRLFMAASAVWFFRVGLMAWAMLTGGVGIDWESFTGPFIYTLGFAQYLLPLAMLEWYFYCERHTVGWGHIAFVSVLVLLTIYMGIGVFAATMGMWLPAIS